MAKKKKTPKRVATRPAPRPVELRAIALRHQAVLQADLEAQRLRVSRDDLIRLGLSQGLSVRSISLALDISRQAVMQIRDVGKVPPPPNSDPLF